MSNGVASLPNPEELAKQFKDETVNVSLRMKPETKQFYDDLAAKDKSLSMNGLMTGVLSAYANYYSRPAAEGKKLSEKVAEYLVGAAERLAPLDDEALLARLFNTKQLLIFNKHGDQADYYGIVRELELAKAGKARALVKAEVVPESGCWGEDNHCMKKQSLALVTAGDMLEEAATVDKWKLYFGDELDEDLDEDEEYAELDESEDYLWMNAVKIQPKYWAMTVAMTNEFMKKMKELMGGKEVLLTRSLAKLVAEAIMAADDDREKLGKLLAEAFTMYVEQTVDA